MPEEVEETEPVDTDTEPVDMERAKAKIAKANAEAAGLRKRLKEAEAKAQQLDQLEDANKSEIQRAADAVKVAEERATAAEMRSMRLEVAASKGLTPAQAKRLVGTTVDEMEADADDLLASFPVAEHDDTIKPPPATKPRQKLKSGGDPTTGDDPPPHPLASALAAAVGAPRG